MDPTATLPKLTAAGLTLRVPEVSEVVVSEVDAVVAEPLPLALVTPEQPLRNAPNRMMKAAKIRDEIRDEAISDELRQLRLARAWQTHE
jgi:hypothetical protein